MAFKHGVYTSEVETALTAAPAVDGSLPFVIGASKNSFGPKPVSSWRQFVELSGIDESVDAVPGDDGWFSLSLVSFAYFWFRIAGRGECIMQGLASVGLTDNASDLSVNDILSALDSLDTIYEQTRRTPSILCIPYFAKTATIQNAMYSKMAQYGGRFKGIALCDIPSSLQHLSDQSIAIVDDPDDALAAKQAISPYLVSLWPYAGVDNIRFDMSTIIAAVMNRVDGENGDLPFVSPSNKNAYLTGLYVQEVVSVGGTGGVGGGSSEEEEPTPISTIENLHVAIDQVVSNDYYAVVDSDESVVFAVEGAGYYISPDNPGMPFVLKREIEDDETSELILCVPNQENIYSSSPFDVQAYASSRTVGTITGCSAASNSSNYGAVILKDGSPVSPIEGAESYESVFVDDTLYHIVPDEYNFEPCLVLVGDNPEGVGPFDIVGLAPSSSAPTPVVEVEEKPVFLNREQVNAKLDGNGIVSALNTADGWVMWGNNTTAYPGNLDVKDYMIPIRRMFNYVQNTFQVFASPRIDNPLNRRQLEGVVNSFNQILASLQGFGALNAASIALDDERNTTAQLLAGVVYFRIRIAPPPPMQVIEGVFEYDVIGFEASLA